MPVTAFLAYLAVQWWAACYPGAEPGGGGYIAQRIFSARTERDGVLATLWFNIAHYAVRPWPWILTRARGAGPLPRARTPARAYVRGVMELLPAGFKGLVLAAFAAAYMSTIATQLNWGASYLVNDLYLRFVDPGAGQRRLVRLSRARHGRDLPPLRRRDAGRSTARGSIEGAWRIILALGAGTGLVYILRWYWWRINAWSRDQRHGRRAAWHSPCLTTIGGFDPVRPARRGRTSCCPPPPITTVVWLAVTFAHPARRPEETLVAFYRRVRPGGPGWRRVQRRRRLRPRSRSPAAR